MKRRLLTLAAILTVLTSCNQAINRQTKPTEINRETMQTEINGEAQQAENREMTDTSQAINSDFKTIDLDFGFKVIVGQEEVLGDFRTYRYFRLTRKHTVLYIDSSSIEYQFGNSLFPIVLQTGDNSFELLFEINDRPSKNYLKRLFIQDGTLVEQDETPAFEAEPIDINTDGIKEYAGFWDYSQIEGDNSNLTVAYNPILYYSVTGTGLKLDSMLTRQRNKMIYGKFYGFLFREDYGQPLSALDKFEQELKLIGNGQ